MVGDPDNQPNDACNAKYKHGENRDLRYIRFVHAVIMAQTERFDEYAFADSLPDGSRRTIRDHRAIRRVAKSSERADERPLLGLRRMGD